MLDGDDYLQRLLLDSDHLSRCDLEVLIERGVNKAVRNIAKEKLHSRKL